MDADFLLIRKMRRGDETAFDLFVHKYYKDILNYCSYHCPDKEYAEDITQETFVRFFTKLSVYYYKGKTKNYLYTIACNLCKDYLKKRKDIPASEIDLNKNAESEEHQIEEVLNKLVVGQALKELSHELKEVVILYYFQELKIKEIAIILQIGIPLVKYRLKQARVQMGKLLRKEETYESERKTYDL